MKKRILSMILSAMMVFTMIPAEVSAEEAPQQTQEIQENQEIQEIQEFQEIQETQEQKSSTEEAAAGEGKEEPKENIQAEPEFEFPVNGKEEIKKMPMTEEEEAATDSIDSTTAIKTVDGMEMYDIPSLGSQVYNSEWDVYSTNYIYNRLSDGEKKYWDALDAIGRAYLTQNLNAPIRDSENAYSETKIKYADYCLSRNRAGDLLYVFIYSNPQYYFFNNGYLYNSSYIIPTFYAEFAVGSSRAAETGKVKAKVAEWERKIAAGTSEEEKARIAHDLIIEKVEYDELYSNTNGVYAYTPYHQSAYSVFCEYYTVCAGYTKAFAMLMNGAGIDTLGVTSSTHAWNLISINDSWYNIDCTWDDAGEDSGYKKIYLFFNRSEDMITGDLDLTTAHWKESVYIGFVPETTLDSGATIENPGTCQIPAATTAVPQIIQEKSEFGVTITLNSATPDADIYYTLNGADPSSARTRCSHYKGPIHIDKNVTVKVMAVSDTNWDSQITSASVYGSVFMVYFESQGGSNVDFQSIDWGSTVKKPADPKYSGYVFGGWYQDQDCKTAWNFNTKVTSNLVLYAKWLKQSTVKFNANSGSVKTKSKKVCYSKKYGTLPTPKRAGYSFSGWYTKKSGGSKITASSTVKIEKTTTLYAHWKKVSVKKAAVSKLKNNTGKKMTVSIKKVSGASGYQIKYSKKSNMKSAKTTSTKTTSKTISGLSKKKKYYVTVRAYKIDSAGKKVYGKWSDVKTLKIRK